MKTGHTVKSHEFISKLRSTQFELRKYIWRRWHNPTGQTTPVFLVGSGRSGTNMLVSQLGQLWQVELYNEDNPAVFEQWRLREVETIELALNRSIAHIALFKPILDTYRTHTLLLKFPMGKVLFAFRHYDDVINSSLKKFGVMNRINHVKSWVDEDFSEFVLMPPPEKTKDFIRSLWKPSLNPESGAALFWLFQNRLYYDLNLNQDDRVRLVRYESVVTNPQKEFEEICSFLNLPFDPCITKGVFASSVKKQDSPDVDLEIREECQKIWESLCLQIGTKEIEV